MCPGVLQHETYLPSTENASRTLPGLTGTLTEPE